MEQHVIARDGNARTTLYFLRLYTLSQPKDDDPLSIDSILLIAPYLSYTDIQMELKAASKSKRENQDDSIMGASTNNPSSRESGNTD